MVDRRLVLPKVEHHLFSEGRLTVHVTPSLPGTLNGLLLGSPRVNPAETRPIVIASARSLYFITPPLMAWASHGGRPEAMLLSHFIVRRWTKSLRGE
jgi:hypothetical protein